MFIIFADVSLKNIDVRLNLVLFWPYISSKEYGIKVSDENKYFQNQLHILFIVEYVILPINHQNLLSKFNYKICKVAY